MSKFILQIIYSCAVKKKAQKSTKYWRNETILKLGHHAKAIAHAKIATLGQKLKFQKDVQIHSTNHLELFCAKNCSKNNQILEKWDQFENQPSWKGHSPCKMLTLGQILKLHKTCQNSFYKTFTIVLWKKPLEKTANIGEMRPFWKSAILQRL